MNFFRYIKNYLQGKTKNCLQKHLNRKKFCKNMSEHSFIDLLGIDFIENSEKNVAIGQIKLVERHSQVYGNAHGGVLYSLADTVAGFLVW